MAQSQDCHYCLKGDALAPFVIEICPMSVSTLYLFREQSYYGRCVVAYKDHINEVFDLSEEQCDAYFNDVSRAALAVSKAVGCDKINYGAFGDKTHHLHFHIVPKCESDEEWGGMFQMNPEKVYLNKDEQEILIKKIKNALVSIA